MNFQPHQTANQAIMYYGITSRHWLHRLKEHVAAANGGSPLLFHRALRDQLKGAARFQHTIIAAGLTKDEAYDVEEYLVAKYSLAANFRDGLNMIPGGYEGLRRLHERGLLAEGVSVELFRPAALRPGSQRGTDFNNRYRNVDGGRTKRP
jgi:hypothetical protein